MFCGRREGGEREAVQKEQLDLRARLAEKRVPFSPQERQMFFLSSSRRQGSIGGAPGSSESAGRQPDVICDGPGDKACPPLAFLLFVQPRCRGDPADTTSLWWTEQEHFQSALGHFWAFLPRPPPPPPPPSLPPDGQFRGFLVFRCVFPQSRFPAGSLCHWIHLFIFCCGSRTE